MAGMSDSKASPPRLLTECLIGAAATVAVALLVHRWISLANLAFLFLVPVIAMAGKRGLVGGLVTALLATLAFNFVFVPPAYTFRVADVDNLVTLCVLALAAALASQFAARLRAQVDKAEALARDSERLGSLTQELACCSEASAVESVVIHRIQDWTGATVRLIDPDEEPTLSPLDAAAARWAMAHRVEAGRGSDVMSGADALYMPIDGSATPVVAQLWRDGAALPIPAGRRDLVRQALARLGATIHRVTVDAREQRDAMREAVLTSIGHDLRTPLTGIIAGLAALTPDADGFVETSRAEAARLEALVTNILDLARLRADVLPEALEAIDLTDAVDAVLSAMSARLAEHQLAVDLPATLSLVRSDPRMLHHMLLNLLDNAVKFSPPGSTITIEGRAQAGITLSICDQGRGLVGTDNGLPKRSTIESVAGSGLGLNVVSGFAKALGIAFTASNRADREAGAQMTLTFPPALCIAPIAS